MKAIYHLALLLLAVAVTIPSSSAFSMIPSVSIPAFGRTKKLVGGKPAFKPTDEAQSSLAEFNELCKKVIAEERRDTQHLYQYVGLPRE